MRWQFVAVVLLCVQVNGASFAQTSKDSEGKAPARPASAITKSMQQLLKKEGAAKSFEEREPLTKELAKLYQEMRIAMRSGSAALLSKDEYRLRMRLVGIVKDLNQKVAKAEEESMRQSAKIVRNPEGYSKSAFAEPSIQGGGTITAANNLIQIIITTIDPDGWQANGGTHVIEYWAQGMALVVAAPADVHDQIGGSLGGIRTQGP